jgi:hypothetical protein
MVLGTVKRIETQLDALAGESLDETAKLATV